MASFELKPNTLLQGGKYKIERVLGQGGFGITYLATQELLDRKVCIKEFFFKDSCNRTNSGEVILGTIGNRDLAERFLNKFIKEARTLSQLDHSNIIRVLDIFKENNTAYYVMDFIEGSSLEDIVNSKGALSESVAIDYIKQVASALDYIHKRNVNHLDVKPANIMIRRSDNKAILIDFGVSKQYDSQGEQTSTTPVGISYGYAPIEQYRPGGVTAFSPQADIYALGATLYKLVTRSTPPQAVEIFNDGLSGLPNSLSPNLSNAIKKAMELKKSDRPQNISEFLNYLNVTHINQKSSACTAFSPKPSADENTISIKPIQAKNEINGHEYVDLGLSVKWATCNIGADKPEEYGCHFAWGEVTPKSSYTELNYKHAKLGKKIFNVFKSTIINDYSINFDMFDNIGQNISNSNYDAAKINWGNSWRLPTEKECEELVKGCQWKWTSQNGKDGYKIIGPNGNSLFLPAAGWHIGSLHRDIGSVGDYWTSTQQNNGTTYASCIHFKNGQYLVHLLNKDHGYSIRPVID